MLRSTLSGGVSGKIPYRATKEAEETTSIPLTVEVKEAPRHFHRAARCTFVCEGPFKQS